MSKCIDLTGQRFGRLVVANRAENYVTPNGAKFSRWNCVCDCGRTVPVVSGDLRSGKTKSCGCYHDECCSKRRYKHGKSGSNLNWIWRSMKARCYNHKNKDYKNYGGRGIEVCDSWKRDFSSFMEWSVSNGYREGLSIDRIDGDKNYCPENCRWTTAKAQANNTRANRKISFGGETHTVSEWSEISGINYRTLVQRLNSGWSAERALTEIVRKKG